MGWMTISSFGSKILVFLMVPFYTRVLSTNAYGIYDICCTTATLLASLLTANIAEALMRYALSDSDHIGTAFSCSFTFSFIVVIVSAPIAIICLSLGTGEEDILTYIGLSALLFAANVIYTLFSQFARGINHVREMAFGGFLNSLLLVLLSLLFVLFFGWGICGCFVGTTLSLLFSGIFICFSCKAWRYLGKPNKGYMKRMIAYGMPLSINTIGWWANNAFSRYAVAAICGLSNAGLLTAAYKIPSIPKAIQQIFVQAWQISAIKEFNREDKDGFFKKTYDAMCIISSILTSVVIIATPLLASILFANEFFEAWQFVPLLMASIVFNCLASVTGAVFLAVGDSKPIATSASASVAVSAAACLALIPVFGTQGAAISSVLSSVVIWGMRMRICSRYITLKVNWILNTACFTVIGIQIILAFTFDLGATWYGSQAVCLITLLLLGAKFTNTKSVITQIKEKRKP